MSVLCCWPAAFYIAYDDHQRSARWTPRRRSLCGTYWMAAAGAPGGSSGTALRTPSAPGSGGSVVSIGRRLELSGEGSVAGSGIGAGRTKTLSQACRPACTVAPGTGVSEPESCAIESTDVVLASWYVTYMYFPPGSTSMSSGSAAV